MAKSGFGPYRGLWLDDAPTKLGRCHPHTMDDDSCAWFHRNPLGARVVVPSLTVVFRDILE